MNPEELLHHLVLLSKSDKNFSDSEFMYILNVAETLGFPQSQLELIIRDSESRELTIPATEQERMKIFYYLLFLMKIDKNISDSETELIHHYGFKLGFSRAMVNDFIDIIVEYKDGVIPTYDMIKVIKKYQN